MFVSSCFEVKAIGLKRTYGSVLRMGPNRHPAEFRISRFCMILRGLISSENRKAKLWSSPPCLKYTIHPGVALAKRTSRLAEKLCKWVIGVYMVAKRR